MRQPADWRHGYADSLRLYHLHYLDQLLADQQPAPGFATALLERWVRDNPPGSSPGWDSYPISRRLTNAIKAALGGLPCSSFVLASLADQCRYLESRLEFHLLANHLLANAKALVFAGAFFSGPQAERWLGRGLTILKREVREQVLSDGGHFERSPMYHALVLEDLLDLLNLSRRFDIGTLAFLREPCARMLVWHSVMRHPDGAFPLFNDSVFDVAPSYEQLRDYAHALGVESPKQNPVPIAALRESGYVRVDVPPWLLFADVGSVSPNYQPGHSHAGTLGWELSFLRERIIVDRGVSTYAPGPIRASERGTAAHNTIVVDSNDSSEMWDAFRVGSRARVFGLDVSNDNDAACVSATHDGYRRLSCRALHARRWRVSPSGVELEDHIDGLGTAELELALHLAPGCVARLISPDRAIIHTGVAGANLDLRLDPAAAWRIEDYSYAPSFGTTLAATVIRGRLHAPLPQRLRTHLTGDTAIP
ncbi:MAG: heparinase II/III domain-containing protein [Steroidobacteraceae bacterium]